MKAYANQNMVVFIRLGHFIIGLFQIQCLQIFVPSRLFYMVLVNDVNNLSRLRAFAKNLRGA